MYIYTYSRKKISQSAKTVEYTTTTASPQKDKTLPQ